MDLSQSQCEPRSRRLLGRAPLYVLLFLFLAALTLLLLSLAAAPDRKPFTPGQTYVPSAGWPPDLTRTALYSADYLEDAREPSFMGDAAMEGFSVRYRLLTLMGWSSRSTVTRIDVSRGGDASASMTTLGYDETGIHRRIVCQFRQGLANASVSAIDAHINKLALKPGANARYSSGADGTTYLLERRTPTTHQILLFSDYSDLSAGEAETVAAFDNAAWFGTGLCATRLIARGLANQLKHSISPH